ncbi:MAG TPA: FAD:protein FMN transferase [Steroidobacteraceae bacterium]|nr:FAD:protein FMN transferase [Steroidobacteraceae bacterium]
MHAPPNAVQLESRGDGVLAATFCAMASPCEVLLATTDERLARQLGESVAAEAWRIERKYSRYRGDSVTSLLNRGSDRAVDLDPETLLLLQFAARCHELSGGAFDITSGVLRRAWKFDGSGRVPAPEEVAALRGRIGFERLQLQGNRLKVPAGMELDFGGIGKEYAVDRALALVISGFEGAALVNFGGDMAASRAPQSGPWRVGVERPGQLGEARLLLDFQRGGLATSGDTHRFIEHEGRRYSHILDVRTGYPVVDPPRSVTVAASCCLEAGMIATLSMLKGAAAEPFLKEQGVTHWCLR